MMSWARLVVVELVRAGHLGTLQDLQVSWLWDVEKEINQVFFGGTNCLELTFAVMGRLGKEQD